MSRSMATPRSVRNKGEQLAAVNAPRDPCVLLGGQERVLRLKELFGWIADHERRHVDVTVPTTQNGPTRPSKLPTSSSADRLSV
jgi:hypothetical protein